MCCLLLDPGCARPALDEEPQGGFPDGAAAQDDGLPADDANDDDDSDDDGDDDSLERDAGTADAGRRDAGRDAGLPERDAGPADTGVAPVTDAGCSGDDCPGGDPCGAEALPGQLQVGAANVSEIRLDGAQVTVANVAAGALVRVELELSFAGCNLIPAPRQVYVGVDGATPECRPGLCSSLPIDAASSFEFSVNAPREPGLHYLSIGLGEALLCSPDGSANTRLAALCVAP